MVRIHGGKHITPEGVQLYVAEDDKERYFTFEKCSFGRPAIQQFIQPGCPIEIDGRRGKYCELTIDSGTKECEVVIRFENGELLSIHNIRPEMKIVAYRNGKG